MLRKGPKGTYEFERISWDMAYDVIVDKLNAIKSKSGAEATAIYAGAYTQDSEFFSFVRHLDVYQKVFRKDTTILLRPDTPLLQYLDSPGRQQGADQGPKPDVNEN